MTYLSVSSSNLKMCESITLKFQVLHKDAAILGWLVILVVRYMISPADRPEFYFQVCLFIYYYGYYYYYYY